MFEKKTVEKSVPPVSIISMLFPDGAGAINNFQKKKTLFVKARAIHGFTISSNGRCCPKIPMAFAPGPKNWTRSIYFDCSRIHGRYTNALGNLPKSSFSSSMKLRVSSYHPILHLPSWSSEQDPRPNQFSWKKSTCSWGVRLQDFHTKFPRIQNPKSPRPHQSPHLQEHLR